MRFINTLPPCARVLSVSQKVRAIFISNDKQVNISKTIKSYSTVILLMTMFKFHIPVLLHNYIIPHMWSKLINKDW